MVVDSEDISVVVVSLVPEEGSVSRVSGSDLESNIITPWLVSVSSTNLIEIPSLVGTVVAFPVDDVVVVSVSSAIGIETVSTVVSNVR